MRIKRNHVYNGVLHVLKYTQMCDIIYLQTHSCSDNRIIENKNTIFFLISHDEVSPQHVLSFSIVKNIWGYSRAQSIIVLPSVGHILNYTFVVQANCFSKVM